MIILRTEPVSVLWPVLLSLSALLLLFAAKAFMRDKAFEKALSGKPFILLTGPDNRTKRKVMGAVSEGRTRTVARPFFGVAKVSNIVLGKREFRLVCFNHLGDNSPRKDALRLRGRKPDFVLFSLRMAPGMDKMEEQWSSFMGAKRLFPWAASVAVMDSHEKTGGITRETMNLLFEDDLFGNPVSDRWSMGHLRAFLEKRLPAAGHARDRPS